MSRAEEAAALITLLRLPRHARPPHLSDAVEEAGSATAVLTRHLEEEQRQPTLFAAPERDRATLIAQAGADLAAWEQEGIRVLTILDPAYPDNLRGVHDRPPLLFVTGELRSEDARAIAIIGSRRASPEGLRLGGVISRSLAALEYTVVSGLAAGIDTSVHLAALEGGGRTLAVIGTGLRRSYPPQNRALQTRIATSAAVISQFWPDSPPSRTSFPQRNALMSGLTKGTVIIEASERSGARIQARAALAHGRPLFLLGSVIGHRWAAELAERPGVHVVARAEEIARTLDELDGRGPLRGEQR